MVITQDGELKEGEIVYLVCIDKKGANYMINRFCRLSIDRYHEFQFTWEMVNGSETVHVPHNILDIAGKETNRKTTEKYNFYRPQVWTVGVPSWEEN